MDAYAFNKASLDICDSKNGNKHTPARGKKNIKLASRAFHIISSSSVGGSVGRNMRESKWQLSSKNTPTFWRTKVSRFVCLSISAVCCVFILLPGKHCTQSLSNASLRQQFLHHTFGRQLKHHHGI